MKRNMLAILLSAALCLTAGCSSARSSVATNPSSEASESVSIMVAAAASLRPAFEEKLIPLFTLKYPHITVEATFDSSGKLQRQIEEGLAADLFMSAAPTQMNALIDKGLVEPATVTDLLENRIVLIEPSDANSGITEFAQLTGAKSIAIGDPDSVPAGQYAKEALTTLGVWEQASAKASLGTNVTEVLNWVAEGSAEVGIVYATDAATTDKVRGIAEAPASSLSTKVIYPAGMVKATTHPREAGLFLAFLSSQESLDVFSAYGFSPNR